MAYNADPCERSCVLEGNLRGELHKVKRKILILLVLSWNY